MPGFRGKLLSQLLQPVVQMIQLQHLMIKAENTIIFPGHDEAP
jgi:hypothetical protein